MYIWGLNCNRRWCYTGFMWSVHLFVVFCHCHSVIWKVSRWLSSGPWFNIRMSSYQYKKSHCGDKTILRPSYLHNGISYTGKMTSLYWIGAQIARRFWCTERERSVCCWHGSLWAVMKNWSIWQPLQFSISTQKNYLDCLFIKQVISSAFACAGMWAWLHGVCYVDFMRSEQNGRHFADEIFKCILLLELFLFWFKWKCSLSLCLWKWNKNWWLNQVSQQMDHKPLPEPILTRLIDPYMHHEASINKHYGDVR